LTDLLTIFSSGASPRVYLGYDLLVQSVVCGLFWFVKNGNWL